MKRMRVFFIDEWNSSRWNGIGTFRDILVPGMLQRGVDIALISLNSDFQDHELALNYGIREIHVPYLPGGWRANSEEVVRLLKNDIPESDHYVFIINHSPCTSLIDSLKESFPFSKVVFVIHDQGWCEALRGDSDILRQIILSNSMPSIVSEQTVRTVRSCLERDKDIYRKADVVVSLCESARKVAIEVYGVPDQKVAMISNALPEDYASSLPDKKEARRLLGFRDDERLLIFVGRAEVHKGMAAILRLSRSLMESGINCRCVVVGSLRNIAKYEKFITPAASRLIFPGHLSRSELRVWYAAVDIGILCSYTEQCSFAALEMMASPMDIVSSSGYGLSDMFNPSLAYMCDPRPVNDDTSYVRYLREGVEFFFSLSERRREEYKEHRRYLLSGKYTLSGMIDGYMHLLDSLS